MGEYDSPRTVAERYGISERTLANWRWSGCGPKFIKLGSGRGARVRYLRADVESWLDEQSRGGA